MLALTSRSKNLPLVWCGGLALLLLAGGCASGLRTGKADTYFQSSPTRLHKAPAKTPARSVWWDETVHSTVRPLGRIVSPSTYVKLLAGTPSALDTNAFGQVPDSGWFTNRINRGASTLETIRVGRRAGAEPAAGEFQVTSGKLDGVSPGFIVRDSKNVTWFVKFDSPAYPKLTTGAELIASRLLHVAGYYVPENYIVDLDVARLRLSTKAKTRDHYNREVPLTQAALHKLLLQLNPDPKNRLRALFSRSLPGQPLGPFRFRGARADDPNDTIPHERRRSLRALRFFYAWLNNTDGRYHNTLDTFERAPNSELGHIDHYLLDFGDALGAANGAEKSTQNGYERRLDWKEIGLRIATLGVRDPLWFRVGRSPLREVGVFESKVFEPLTWTPRYNNPAFQAANRDDLRWAASILAYFGDEEIAAAVDAARYDNEPAADWIKRVLMERRNKILRASFASQSSLDLPRVVDGVLALSDLTIVAELPDAAAQSYAWTVRWSRNRRRDLHIEVETTSDTMLDLRPLISLARSKWKTFGTNEVLTVTVGRTGLKPRAEVDVVVRGSEIYAAGMRY